MANHTAPLSPSPSGSLPAPTFNRERHVKYHLRCMKTFLPTLYTSYDANRMMLAFFTLSSLDIMDCLQSSLSSEERAGFIEWIYNCQIPEGGFRAFPGTNFGEEKRSTENSRWDPANLAGTLFALLNLLILADDLERVKRVQTLEWLMKLQLQDGSFGELLGADGKPEGGRDMRFAYIATCIRYILRGNVGNNVKDIDRSSLVRFVLSSQTYDGGFAKEPFHESHAGHTFCGLSILTLLREISAEKEPALPGAINRQAVDSAIKWLVSRQTSSPLQGNESDEPDEHDEYDEFTKNDNTGISFRTTGAISAAESNPQWSLHRNTAELQSAGFNGRCNKPEDTCYSFWVVGSLHVLGKAHLINPDANRRFLLDRTQHLAGGFSKVPGQPPDVMHSNFGLAALSLMGDDGFKPLATMLCITTETSARIKDLSWKQADVNRQ